MATAMLIRVLSLIPGRPEPNPGPTWFVQNIVAIKQKWQNNKISAHKNLNVSNV